MAQIFKLKNRQNVTDVGQPFDHIIGGIRRRHQLIGNFAEQSDYLVRCFFQVSTVKLFKWAVNEWIEPTSSSPALRDICRKGVTQRSELFHLLRKSQSWTDRLPSLQLQVGDHGVCDLFVVDAERLSQQMTPIINSQKLNLRPMAASKVSSCTHPLDRLPAIRSGQWGAVVVRWIGRMPERIVRASVKVFALDDLVETGIPADGSVVAKKRNRLPGRHFVHLDGHFAVACDPALSNDNLSPNLSRLSSRLTSWTAYKLLLCERNGPPVNGRNPVTSSCRWVAMAFFMLSAQSGSSLDSRIASMEPERCLMTKALSRCCSCWIFLNWFILEARSSSLIT